ncbi:MAG: dihydrofolate reductase [Bacteroidaceae bacterium]|nr:dihydrofolate reductase [Bacteroidaceae bacterium]
MRKLMITLSTAAALLSACSGNVQKQEEVANDDFTYQVEKFADLEVLRYQVPGFEELSLQQRTLLYYLSQAALEGRDILFDQNCKYNLQIRRTLEAIYENYEGDRNDEQFRALELYLKRVWFSNGIHHHYAEDKFKPGFSADFFAQCVSAVKPEALPLKEGQSVQQLIAELTPVIQDSTIMSKRTVQSGDGDLILASANNYYDGVTQAEVEAFYAAMKDPKDEKPVMYGLNSRLVKENGVVKEKVWKVGGLYTEALERIVGWLEKAAGVAENDAQKAVIETLIEYYRTGDLKKFDDYAMLWVYDLDSRIDFVNGFTESYGDPLGMKASWESVVNFKNIEATKRTEVISDNAQWFEDNSPVAKEFKKEKVKGVSAKVITVAMLGGDCYPATPIGINLPNSNWIRAAYGSKSVTIENITEAYDRASAGGGQTKEFAWSDVEVNMLKEYGFVTDNLHTDLHECLGHGSGKLLPGVDPDALRSYGSTVEEARADLFALYYVADKKMVELNLLPNEDAYKAEYYKYMMNGLMTQLTRVELGNNVEEAHMRNRQLIARWALENAGKECVELAKKDGKTYVVIHDYDKLREAFGQLLTEVQRIKSTGDYEAAKQLVESYGVKVDADLHKEILDRFAPLNIVPYRGFVNPRYVVTTDDAGSITDVQLDYTEGYVEQMMRYSKEYSSLPSVNN